MNSAEQTAATVAGWLRSERRVVAARLTRVEGSAPFDVGASMYVLDDGAVEGSVTGGCVEAAVAHEALELLTGHRGAGALTYGVSDELAGTVGLMCGGTVDVFIHELAGESRRPAQELLEAKAGRRECVLATVLNGPSAGASLLANARGVIGSLAVTPMLDERVADEARNGIKTGGSVLRKFGRDGTMLDADVSVLFTVSGRRPRLVLIGAVDFSAAVASIADAMGYHVTVADPRPAFLQSPRLTRGAEVICAWPQEVFSRGTLGNHDAVIVFSHDPKIDVPAVMGAFTSGAGYIGALGSRRTAADRELRLRDAGATDGDLERLHAPCGLDIGARTPEETAIAILAEVTAHRTSRTGGSLRSGDASIRAREP